MKKTKHLLPMKMGKKVLATMLAAIMLATSGYGGSYLDNLISVEAAGDTSNIIVDILSGESFSEETLNVGIKIPSGMKGVYSIDNGPEMEFYGSTIAFIGKGKIGDSVVNLNVKVYNGSSLVEEKNYAYNKNYEIITSKRENELSSYYSTNENGKGVEKTISVDGDISDWDSSMLIARGTANDDPRVYRPDSMYDAPEDLYGLYAAYDDMNLYLMWEMTNVTDVVAKNDLNSITEKPLYETANFPFYIAIETGKSDLIGNGGRTVNGGTIWNSGLTFGNNKFNKLVAVSSNNSYVGKVFAGSEAGISPVALQVYNSDVSVAYGKGILSDKVYGLNNGYGNRFPGDVKDDNGKWVNFNKLGHDSANMDYHYEVAIPYKNLGISKADVEGNGLGVMLISTAGKSGMDCLPYDLSMNDNAAKDDSGSTGEDYSNEKSDEDDITAGFARVGAGESGVEIPLQVNFGADKSAPQLEGTTLKLTGIAYGGTVPYTYKYFVNGKEVGSSWSPKAGEYEIKCQVTDGNGEVATATRFYEVQNNIEELSAGFKLNGNTTDKTVCPGETLKFVATANGGSGEYLYQFVLQNTSTGKEAIIRDYVTSQTFNFTLTGSGSKYAYVNVKDAKTGKIVCTNKVKVTLKSQTTDIKADFTVNGSKASQTLKIGTTYTFETNVTGGSGNYKYKIEAVNPTTGKKSLMKDFGAYQTYAYKPSMTGTKNFIIYVKDVTTGKIVASNTIQITIKK